MHVRMLTLVLAAVLSIPTPAQPNSSAPYLSTTPSGAVMMSWIEGDAVKFSMFLNGKWSTPRVIVKGEQLMINSADFPSVMQDAKGTLYATWLQNSTHEDAYDVWVGASVDGQRWLTRVLHRDRGATEHGFASLVPLANGGVGAVWLNGVEDKPTELRYTELGATLKSAGETLLDARVCDCCATGMTMTANGPVVAFRDRSDDEVRDIAVTRRVKGIWSKPARVNADEWKIAGCPVNGPQLASRGNDVVIAWFSAANNQPRVSAAFSRDGGATFGKAIRIDTANTIGRVDTLMLADGSALVTWIEGDALFTRRVFANGRVDAPLRLATLPSARAAGFPRATLAGNTAYFAWTDPATKTIRLVALKN